MINDITALTAIFNADPQNHAVFRALLAMLKTAPDSSIIIAGLSQVKPDTIEDQSLRNEAAELLEKANAEGLAQNWRGDVSDQISDQAQSNVVPLIQNNANVNEDFSQKISFSDIGGLENVKRQVRRKIISPFQEKKALFKKFKRKAGGGVLMYGPPGCGKTMLARALATECQAVFKDIRPADILDQYVGNAEKRINSIFKSARAHTPTVLFFDEIEALAQKRQFEGRSSVNTVVSALLSEMDGFSDTNEGVLFLAATNVPWSLDTAFRRPGRFDRTIFVPPPDRIARHFILTTLLSDRPVSPTLDLNKIVEKSTGFSGADLAGLVETATDYAIEESTDIDNISSLSQLHFDEAFQEVRSSVGEWLGQARGFAEYANETGMYDDLAAFLKKYAA